MNIKKIEIRNFLAIQDATIELADRGLILVQGENLDDTSTDSNGAGKSTIADAIAWGLYGVTARGVTADAVVNKLAKKDCCVRILLEDEGGDYEIVRYRKDVTFKNQTLVELVSESSKVALHKAIEKETQEVINGIIGCSLEVFQAAVYAGQECMADLPAMTDKQLKLMIEEAAGVEILASAYTKAREQLLLLDKEFAIKQSAVISGALRLKEIEGDIAEQKVKLKEFEDSRKVSAKAELVKAAPILELLSELRKGQLTEKLELAVKAELSLISEKFLAIKSEQAELQNWNDKVRKAENEVATLATIARTEQANYRKACDAVENISEKIGKPCGECGKAYCAHDMEEATKLAVSLRDELEASLLKQTANLKTVMAASKKLSEQAEDYRRSMTDTSALASSQTALNESLAENELVKRKIAGAHDRIEQLKIAAKNFLDQPNPYTLPLKTLEDRLSAQSLSHKLAQAELTELDAKLSLQKAAVQIFGPSGVRAHILDTVTPYLNERTSHYLSSLADGNIEAVWNTLSTNAKGELKERFNIEVKNTKGAESFAGLSGGEKRKVRIACALALQDMVSSRATKPINILICDEVDHALDESGLERLMTIFNEKAKERGTVMVISHSDLKDWIDTSIIVTKEGGFSKVSGDIAA